MIDKSINLLYYKKKAKGGKGMDTVRDIVTNPNLDLEIKRKKFGIMVGEKIKHYRKMRGLTLQELANQTDYTLGYIGALEKGKNVPNTFVLTQIAIALGIPTAALLDEEGAYDIQGLRDPILTDPKNKVYLDIMKSAAVRKIPANKLEKAIDFLID